MDTQDARLLDQLVYDLILGDFPRGQNRAMIAKIANGAPPYTDEEVEENQIEINVNDLAMTRALHDARANFNNGFLKPGNFFGCSTDMGPKHKRTIHAGVVTRAINRPMKRSISYFEYMRSKFGLLTLHGIAPGVWEKEDKWCPRAMGIEDVLIPSNTLLGFENLPFFFLRRSFTGYELQKLTMKAKADKGWDAPLVKRCLEWADQQTTQMMGNSPWPDYWAPEKIQERIKQDGGFYVSDQVPTIDTFDCYIWDDSEGEEGWVRRIILDSWSTPAMLGGKVTMNRDNKKTDLTPKKGDFLYNSGERKVGSSLNNLISFQFADLSAVAPFKYHSVRSLGFLLYSICHLQNRMRCRFNEAVFEALLQYFRVKSMDDAQRALKLDLVNRGILDDTITPLPPNERWQPNAGLVELGLKENAGIISDSVGSFSQRTEGGKDRTEKTKFQVMAEMNAMNSLVGAALQQAYMYQDFEYREIFRRFMNRNSNDADVKEFRATCLRQGVPEKMLIAEAWDIASERIMGGGNKTLEMTIAQQLMEWRQQFDPEPQRKILRDSVLAITDDPARAEELVPEIPLKSTPSTHDAALTAATLMAGIDPGEPMTGTNHIEIVETLLKILAQKVQEGSQTGMLPAEKLQGLSAVAQYTAKQIAIIAQDEKEKERVKKYGDALGKIDNELKAFAQRLEQQMKKQQQAAAQNGGGGMDPKDAAKIQATMAMAKTKQDLAKQSHAARTAQKQLTWEQQMAQKAQEHQAELHAKDLHSAEELAHNRLRNLEDEKPPDKK